MNHRKKQKTSAVAMSSSSSVSIMGSDTASSSVINVNSEKVERSRPPKQLLLKISSVKRKSENNNETSLKSLNELKLIQETKNRPMIKAKRKLPIKKSNKTISGKQGKIDIVDLDDDKIITNDTPQMKLLRVNLQKRKIKGNAAKKSKIIKDVEIKKEQSPESTSKRNNNYNNNNNKALKTATNLRRYVRKNQLDKPDNKKLNKIPTEKSTKLRKLQSAVKHDKNEKNSEDSTVTSSPSPLLKSFYDQDKKISAVCKKLKIKKHKNVSTVNDNKNDYSLLADDLGLSVSSSSVDTNINTNINYTVDTTKISRVPQNHDSRVKKLPNQCTDSRPSKLNAATGNVTSPTIYKNAEERLSALRKRLALQISADKKLSSSVDESNTNKIDDFCEDMDWEPIEEEKIVFEVQAVRAQLQTDENDVQMKELPYHNSNTAITTGGIIYIVIDTNVLLSNIETIEHVREKSFQSYGKPKIVIPWTVVRELDFIKDDKSNTRTESLKAKARQAIRFLYDQFSVNNPQFIGQKIKDAMTNRKKFSLECPDDEILQTCLQIQLTGSIVVLLSFDKNLCIKAMIHGITTIGKDDPPDKINQLLKKKCGIKLERDVIKDEFSFRYSDNNNDYGDDNISIPLLSHNLRADDTSLIPASAIIIFEESKNVLTSFLNVIVAQEMENVYGENWQQYIQIRPPWDAVIVLRCAIKYFISVVGDSFIRKAELMLKDLLNHITKFERNIDAQLCDVAHIINIIGDLIQCINNCGKYSSVLEKALIDTRSLRDKCANALKYEENMKNKNVNIKNDDDDDNKVIKLNKDDQLIRADIGFKYFETIYSFTRDFCGAAAEIVGIPCTFEYKPLNSSLLLLSVDDIKRVKSDIASNLNQLLQALSVTMDNIDKLNVNHQYVITIYQLLTTYLPEMTREVCDNRLLPADIYYCLRYKEKNLRYGVAQLQELSIHFSRIAQFISQ